MEPVVTVVTVGSRWIRKNKTMEGAKGEIIRIERVENDGRYAYWGTSRSQSALYIHEYFFPARPIFKLSEVR